MKIGYSFETHPLGTAGPLSLVTGLEDTFLVTNGDVLTMLDFSDLISTHLRSGAAATIATHHRQVKIDLGAIETNGSNEITGYIEKPTYHFHVSMGIYVFEQRVLPYIREKEYLGFLDLVLNLIAAGENVISYSFYGYWQDLGRPDDYEQALEDFNRLSPKIMDESEPQAGN